MSEQGKSQTHTPQQYPVWKTIFQIIRRSEIPWGWLVLTLVIMFGYSEVYLMFPDYTEQIINGDISQNTIIAFIIVILGTMALSAIQVFVAGLTEVKIAKGMQNTAWKAVTNLSISQIEQENSKELISRVTTDTESVSTMLSSNIPNMLQRIWLVVGSLMAAAGYDSSLLITLILLLVLHLVTAFIAGRYTFRFNQKTQKRMAEMTKLVSEVMSNIPIVKIFVAEDKEIQRGEKSILGYLRAQMIAQNVTNAFQYLASFVNLIGMLAVVILGGSLVGQGRIDIGEWIAYIMYYRTLTYSVQMLPYYWRATKACQGRLYRLSMVISQQGEDLDAGESVVPHKGDFALENVSFGYEEKDVLKNVSFRIPAGQLVAIAGENGAGKTTIIRLLERFYQPHNGRITYGGKDAASLKLADWRNLFSYVPQDVRLVSGTLRENLTYGVGRTVSEEELTDACRRSRADRFIAKLPDGMNTVVEELGDNFSGGQRQQIAITRAILRDRECLLLDEFTSNLDPEAEAHVLEALQEVRRDKTVVVIAHKISTIKQADSIIMLEQGRVSAVGGHDALMESCEAYRAMVRAQTVEAV